jgi:uncharacterized protein (DUF58 family)
VQLPLSLTLLLVALILGQLLLALVMLLAVLMLLVLALLLMMASVKAWDSEGQNVVVPRSLVQAVQQHHLSPSLILMCWQSRFR